jgi:hypothetical protein
MIGRRVLLCAGMGLAARRAAAALPVPPAGTLAFRMVRHGSEIGRHTLTFERQGDVLTVRVAVDARITLLSIPIVRYRHRLVETWQGDTLVGLAGETDNNGRRSWVKAHHTGEGLVVEGSQVGRYVAPNDAISISYWNKRQMDGPMISSDDGLLVYPKVEMRGLEAVRLASGATITARHYNVSDTFKADVWYDLTDTWASLGLIVADGSAVRYERL